MRGVSNSVLRYASCCDLCAHPVSPLDFQKLFLMQSFITLDTLAIVDVCILITRTPKVCLHLHLRRANLTCYHSLKHASSHHIDIFCISLPLSLLSGAGIKQYIILQIKYKAVLSLLEFVEEDVLVPAGEIALPLTMSLQCTSATL